MGTVVLDANVLIALANPVDALHRRAAAAARAARNRGAEFVVPATVLAEALVAHERRGRGARDQARKSIESIARIVSVDVPIAEHTASIRAHHPSVRLPDAIVVATAIERDADALLTGDRRLASIDSRIQLI